MIAFALRGLAWSLVLFGLFRLSWFEIFAVLPLTGAQARAADLLFGPGASLINVTTACSGADAVALCAGAILAYPAILRLRLLGVASGIALILSLNVVRLGTLGRTAGSPFWFDALHLYLWPAILAIAIAIYVYVWMRFANLHAAQAGAARPRAAPAVHEPILTPHEARRFVLFGGLAMLIFIAAAPLYLESQAVLSAAGLVAKTAAGVLGFVGVTATSTNNVLSTSRGAFLVTQECIVTPLIPIYLAAVLAYPLTRTSRALGLLAALPFFLAMGVARLLVIALPAALVSSPLFVIHAFYQLILAAIAVTAAAALRYGKSPKAVRRAVEGGLLGCVFVLLLGAGYANALITVAGADSLFDSQGALALLPSFQVGLYVALCVAGFIALPIRSFLSGLIVLCVSQPALFIGLRLLAEQTGLTLHVRDIRGWAVAAPILLCALIASRQPSQAESTPTAHGPAPH